MGRTIFISDRRFIINALNRDDIEVCQNFEQLNDELQNGGIGKVLIDVASLLKRSVPFLNFLISFYKEAEFIALWSPTGKISKEEICSAGFSEVVPFANLPQIH